MEEIAVPSGGPWGGKTVDESFLALLKQSFGDETIDLFMNKKPQAWLKLMTNFDTAKRTFNSAGNTPLRFELGYVFYNEISMMKKPIEEGAERCEWCFFQRRLSGY